GTATLKGAEYGVYKDKACKDKVDTLITDAKGAAQSKELPLGNYYVKETKNPVGFLIDPNVYPVDLTTDDKTERVFYKT
ncbi:prealbumin-like fold domain-containing protein, partial [Acinetobacter baumannii]|nr:prealbumin-like fold domain-containing protein [Acinetobacter baumannii]